MMKNMAAGAFSLLLLGCVNSPPDQRDGLRHILRMNTLARGGREAIEAVHALRLTVRIQEPTFVLTGTYVATRKGHVRVDVYDGNQRVFTEALGPTGGWQWHGGENRTLPLSPAGAAALRRGLISNLYALYEWPDHNYRLTLVEPQESDTPNPYWVVSAVEQNGFTKRLWIDKESYLVIREYEVSALHPDLNARAKEQYSVTKDWEYSKGVLMPRVTAKIDAATENTIQNATVLSRQLVCEKEGLQLTWMLDSYFERPRFQQVRRTSARRALPSPSRKSLGIFIL